MANSTVRYGSNAESNAQLLSALAQVANYRCYSCREPKEFSDLQIDHLLPQSMPPAKLASIAPGLGLQLGFDLNGPENLAVICGKCNRSKSNKDFHKRHAFQMQLDSSIKRAAKVTSLVVSARTGNGLSAALASASAADLTVAAAKDVFLSFAPGLVQRLALLDENLVDYVSVAAFQGRESHQDYDLNILFNNNLRFVQRLTTLLVDEEFDAIAQASAGSLVVDVLEKARLRLEAGPDDGYSRELAVADPAIHYFEVRIDDGEVEWDGNLLELTIKGEIDGWLSTHVTGDDPNEPGSLRDSQTEVSVYGRFETRATLAPDDDAHTFEHNIARVDPEPDWGTEAWDRAFEDF